MREELAKLIVAAHEEDGDDSVRIREGYSGRGMYGDSTTGIVAYDLPQALMKTMAYVARQVSELPHEGAQEMIALLEEASDDQFRQDSMGHDTIFY